MLTMRDYDFLHFMEAYGSLTSKQAAKIFLNDTNNGEIIARRRFREIAKYTELDYMIEGKRIKHYYTKTPPTPTSTKLIDLYAELASNNAEMLYFEKEPIINGVECDAFMVYKIKNKEHFILVDIDIFNSINTAKYKPIYDSNEFQKEYGVFPTIVIMSPKILKSYRRNQEELPYKVVKIDFELDIKELLK